MRKWLNEHPRATSVAVGAVVVVAIGFIIMQVMGARQRFPTKLPDAYYTTDDGKTFFVANTQNVPPFPYEGQVAVRAYVFACSGKRFVGYLERYTPAARAKLLQGKQVSPQVQIYGRELKKPGDATWVKSGDYCGGSEDRVSGLGLRSSGRKRLREKETG